MIEINGDDDRLERDMIEMYLNTYKHRIIDSYMCILRWMPIYKENIENACLMKTCTNIYK